MANASLWLRPLDALTAQQMPGTEDATYPFWSPDSRYIGFFAEGKLKKIAASGGPAQSLCDAPDGRGGSWNRDDVIIFAPNIAYGVGIQRVPASGDVPVEVTRPKGGGVRFPVFAPDGRHFLFLMSGGPAEQKGVYLSSLDGKENRRVLADQSGVVLAAGRLLFIRENTLMAQPFDGNRGQATGEVFPVAEGVSFITVTNFPPVTVSENGMLLYESGGRLAFESQMAWYDRTGKLLGAVAAPGLLFEPAISPNEKSLIYGRVPNPTSAAADLWLRDLTRGAEQRFTTDASPKQGMFWSPTGDRIVFSANRSGTSNLYQKAASGTGQDEPLLTNGNSRYVSQWSRDGRFIVYTEQDPKTTQDIWALPMDSAAQRKPTPFLRSEFNESFGQLSPDSHWMAYTSDESGQPEVYVRPFPGAEFQRKISIAGGEQPRWRGDGRELFFVGKDEMMMAVRVKAVTASGASAKSSFEAGVPQRLFETHLPYINRAHAFEYDVTADGKRFLLLTTLASGSAPVGPLTVVVNWDAGLKK
jgi:Tol biopolymer transport system component